MTYWEILEGFIDSNKTTIEREKGSHHPIFKNMIFPVDYGYIHNTNSMDGNCIDIFIGKEKKINGIACTIDRKKGDSEIKVIYGCKTGEIDMIIDFLNNSSVMKAIFIKREKTDRN